MDWRPVLKAATFGLSDWTLSDLRKLGWQGLGIYLGALVLAIPVFWVAGVVAALLLGSPFGFDIDGSTEANGTQLSDHIRLVLSGFVVLVGGYWAWMVFLAFVEEWSDWGQAKRRLKAEREAERRSREH